MPITRRATLVAGVVAVAGGAVGGWEWLRPDPVPPETSAGDSGTATVARTDLSAREQLPGTVGYAGDWSVVHPGPPAVLTAVAAASTVVTRGRSLYEVDGRPVVLLYGARPVWRAFDAGMAPGEDVRQLALNLSALGFGTSAGDRFTAATASAVRGLQRSLGQPQTGRLPLGTVVFAPDALRVVEVLVPVGTRLGGDPVLRASSTRRVVTVALPTSRQGQIAVGAAVEVTLPGGRRTAGTVADVASSAEPARGSASATIAVTVDIDQAVAAGQLDQAPVQVAVITVRRTGVLAVPVTALRAGAAPGTYEVVVVDGDARRPLPVRPGLIDERAGLVEVTGDGLAAGMRVEVPRE